MSNGDGYLNVVEGDEEGGLMVLEEETDNKQRVIDAIRNMESEDFSDFYDKVKEMMGDDEEQDGVIVLPESKIDARNWVFAFVKMKEEIEFLKKEYIPALTEKYIRPVKDRVERLEVAQGFIKEGLFSFMGEIGEKKIAFPDLATVSEAKTQPKVIYPDDEKAFLELLLKEESDLVAQKPSIDKKKILTQFKETGELAHEELVGEAAGTAVRVTVAKSRK